MVAAAKREATLSNSIEAILEEGSGSDGVLAFYKIVDYPGRLRIQLDAGCVGPHDVSISNNQLHSRDVPLSAAGKHSRPLGQMSSIIMSPSKVPGYSEIGHSMPRASTRRLVAGRGRYVDDMAAGVLRAELPA